MENLVIKQLKKLMTMTATARVMAFCGLMLLALA